MIDTLNDLVGKAVCPDEQQKSQGNGPTPVINLPEPGTTEIQAPAFRVWRSNVVTAWLLVQRPGELTRACLRGIIPRCDPQVADQLFLTIAEQLAAIAIAQGQAAEVELKAQEAARQQEAVEKALASGLVNHECSVKYDSDEYGPGVRCHRPEGHRGEHGQ